MNVAILGLGKLGLPMAAFYASAGHKVVGIDLRDDLIEQLTAGTFRTDEPEVNDLLRQNADRLTFTRLPYEAVLRSEIVFVVVPTPSKPDGTFDSAQVVTACQQFAAALHDKDAYTLVVVVSTLMPGQMDADVLPALERASGKRAGIDFGVCYSPEFIALGRVIEGLRTPDYVLIGDSVNPISAASALSGFYDKTGLRNVPVRRMSFVNAELAKLATNAYLSLKIAYANVLGQICEQLPGANVDVVTQAVGSDHRIGGAYLRAGLPAGGPCLPRDLTALITLDDYLNPIPDMDRQSLLRSVDDFGDYYQFSLENYILRSLPEQALVGVLGTAYNSQAAIQEASAGQRIVQRLAEWNYRVSSCALDENAQALVDANDVVILALPLDSYKTLTFHAGQFVADIWRVLDPAQMPDGVLLWQFGVGAKVDPYEGAIHGERVTLSAPFGGILTCEEADAAGLVDVDE